jgi:tRNA/rRNA methyltransferase
MGTMLSEEELERVCVVLVRARNPSNIGAVARAMHDFGFRRMRVVNEFPVPFEAARSAVDASAVLADAVACASVAEAVADCTLVVGTTAVGERELRHELLTLADAAPRMRVELRRGDGAGVCSGRVALLFGSEKTGLSNEEMSHCNWLLTVPMHQIEGARHLSMNLGQAVAVCLYELVREAPASRGVETVEGTEAPATAAQLERVTALFGEVLERSGYARRHAANSEPAQVRRLVRRIGANAVDAPVWMGILRHVLRRLGGAAPGNKQAAGEQDQGEQPGGEQS